MSPYLAFNVNYSIKLGSHKLTGTLNSVGSNNQINTVAKIKNYILKKNKKVTVTLVYNSTDVIAGLQYAQSLLIFHSSTSNQNSSVPLQVKSSSVSNNGNTLTINFKGYTQQSVNMSCVEVTLQTISNVLLPPS